MSSWQDCSRFRARRRSSSATIRRTWYQAYADAQRNVQQKNWNAAIADIEAASRLGAPKPGRNILFYGDVYGNFIPDYYLGLAYLGLNRPDDADRAFERVKQAQLIAPRDNLYAEFTRQATTVKDLLAKQAASAAGGCRHDAESAAGDSDPIGAAGRRRARSADSAVADSAAARARHGRAWRGRAWACPRPAPQTPGAVRRRMACSHRRILHP